MISNHKQNCRPLCQLLLLSFLCFCLQVFTSGNGWAANPPAPRDKVLFQTLSLAKRIVNDSLMPAALQGAKLKERRDEFTADDPALPRDDFKVAKFDIVLPRNNVLPSQRFMSLFAHDSGEYSLLMFLSNDDITEVAADADWNKLQPEWDKFISRYWPGMQRRTDWQNAIGGHPPGSDVFNVVYTIEDQELRLAEARLKIRLADGKVGGIDYRDNRPFIRKELKGKPVPPPVSRQTLTAAVERALKSGTVQPGALVRWQTLTNVRLISTVRRYSASQYAEEPADSNAKLSFGLMNSMVLKAEGPGQQKFVVFAEYDESKKQAIVGGVDAEQPERERLKQQKVPD